MNGGGDELSAVVDQCTWPVSATNKSESMWALGKLIQEFSPASSTSLLHDVLQIGTSDHDQINPQPNRNVESDQLVLEKLAQELSVSNITSKPSLLPPLTTLSLNEIVEISHHQRFDQNPHFSSAGMTRSESEMALDKLVEELSATASSMVPQLMPPINNDNMMKIENLQHAQASSSDVYSVLKSKLNMACAAAAIQFRAGSFTYPQNRAQAEQDLEPAPEYSEIDVMRRKRKVQIRQIISDASSKEDSETINEQMDPEEAKRARRLEVNRNSARSYRRRRQGQIREIQVEIDKLMDEHASMATDFSKMQKKHDDALVENEKLKDEIGTLTARVNKVEETVEQLMKLNPMFILNFRTHGGDMQFVGSQANHTSSNVLSKIGPNSIQQAHPYNDNIAPSTSSLQRVANIYFLDNNNNNNNNNVAIKPQIDHGSRISSVSNNQSGNDMAFMQGRHFFG